MFEILKELKIMSVIAEKIENIDVDIQFHIFSTADQNNGSEFVNIFYAMNSEITCYQYYLNNFSKFF